MKFVVDTHTHTIASGHAYSTISENALAAKSKGLAILCTTDHAPSMPGAPHIWFFGNQKVIPRFLHQIAIIRGIEANTLNEQGEVDLPEAVYSQLDWIIGSFHEVVFPPSTEQIHTKALINLIKSGKVDCLGHLGNPNYPFDIITVLKCAKEHNVAIEINNTSLTGRSRIGSKERCDEIVKQGKEIGVFFSTGSDAHFCEDIAVFNLVEELIEKYQIDEEKIITTSSSKFLNFLLLRGKKKILEFETLY